MIRTLRITSVVAGLLAVGVLAFFSVSRVKGDPEVERLLQSPTVIELAAKDKGKSGTNGYRLLGQIRGRLRHPDQSATSSTPHRRFWRIE